MKLIKPSFEIITQLPGMEGVFKHIEIAGRTCYKSDDKITDTSYKKFIDMLKGKAHNSVLEHGTVYLKLIGAFLDPEDSRIAYGNYLINHYINNPYSKVKIIHDENWKSNIYITTNYRVLIENNWLDDLKYICEPTEFHEKRVTVRFTTQVAITREFNRHRVNSIAEQSTRYVNYGNRFGEISINLPEWVEENKLGIDGNGEPQLSSLGDYCEAILYRNDIDIFTDIDYWLFANLACEHSYLNLIRLGRKPQEARAILPFDTNTELVHTAFISDWEHFFNLRCDQSAHPDARILAIPLEQEFIKRGLVIK